MLNPKKHQYVFRWWVSAALGIFCFMGRVELKATSQASQVNLKHNNKEVEVKCITNDLPVQVAKWLNGKKGAVSLTFDDGSSKQRTLIIPELNKRKLRGTFFLIKSYFDKRWDKWENWLPVIAQGHEIGSHSVTHPPLSLRSELIVRKELIDSKVALQRYLKLKEVVVFAYPGSNSNAMNDRICAEYYLGSRSSGHRVISATPKSLHSLPSIPWVSKSNAEYFNQWVDRAIKSNGWIIELCHSVNGQGWEAPALSVLVTHFDYLESKSSELWVAPMGEVIKYIILRQLATITIVSQTKNHLQLQITFKDKLPPASPKLSITFVLPNKSLKSTALISDKSIPVNIIQVNGKRKGVINITPVIGKSVVNISF